eukprot:CAMPEP_0182864820 /NCGR_PEP_ID=MMETSP0034_2-20130328/7367_1 /TAXON_ID=156128 /ORGANISM="Nephroselmis pyriformis, Strain CCMP717" /LENGTH=169 /DNA_ID=CAMNT_0024997089 /DNA_START=1 /DNA_END=507 /DNA_ORIENTATION=-
MAPCVMASPVMTTAARLPSVSRAKVSKSFVGGRSSLSVAIATGRRPALKRVVVTRAAAGDEGEQDVADLESKLGLGSGPRKSVGGPQLTAAQKPLPVPTKKEWDQMNPLEKSWELYAGEKGALFWLNEIAYKGSFALVVLWILFRFVGPALGLYDLVNPFVTPESFKRG